MSNFPPVPYIRIFADEAGESHLEAGQIPVDDEHAGRVLLGRSVPFPATSLTFVAGPADWDYGWHNAPRRQFVVLLSGSAEIETSDGDVRRLEPGALILAEDTEGKGHITRSVGSSRVLLGIVPVTPD